MYCGSLSLVQQRVLSFTTTEKKPVCTAVPSFALSPFFHFVRVETLVETDGFTQMAFHVVIRLSCHFYTNKPRIAFDGFGMLWCVLLYMV